MASRHNRPIQGKDGFPAQGEGLELITNFDREVHKEFRLAFWVKAAHEPHSKIMRPMFLGETYKVFAIPLQELHFPRGRAGFKGRRAKPCLAAGRAGPRGAENPGGKPTRAGASASNTGTHRTAAAAAAAAAATGTPN
ncbi:hypothetical protein ANO11243_063820 [Dothideomycetidae sp. 11243]|nr:hypothetical protein ANO11243_063820 [fungal sp. No.11243]